MYGRGYIHCWANKRGWRKSVAACFDEHVSDTQILHDISPSVFNTALSLVGSRTHLRLFSGAHMQYLHTAVLYTIPPQSLHARCSTTRMHRLMLISALLERKLSISYCDNGAQPHDLRYSRHLLPPNTKYASSFILPCRQMPKHDLVQNEIGRASCRERVF